MYDTDGDEKIQYGDVVELYEAILSILGDDPGCGSSHKLRVDSLFKICDSVCYKLSYFVPIFKDGDWELTKDEFLMGSLRDDLIVKALSIGEGICWSHLF